jgi:hypothetical protein
MPAAVGVFDSDDSASISSESSGGFTEVVSRMSAVSGATGGAGTSDKALEEKYQKLSLLEHIRKIPDTYIGSIEKTQLLTYVWNGDVKKFTEENKQVEILF